MLKSDARKELLKKRKALTESDCIKLDDLLLIQLQKLDWSTTRIVGSFYPSDAHAEPNSLLLVKFLKYYIPELVVVYPVIHENGSTMDFYEETVELLVNQWGIHEPIPNKLYVLHSLIFCFFSVPILGLYNILLLLPICLSFSRLRIGSVGLAFATTVVPVDLLSMFDSSSILA